MVDCKYWLAIRYSFIRDWSTDHCNAAWLTITILRKYCPANCFSSYDTQLRFESYSFPYCVWTYFSLGFTCSEWEHTRQTRVITWWEHLDNIVVNPEQPLEQLSPSPANDFVMPTHPFHLPGHTKSNATHRQSFRRSFHPSSNLIVCSYKSSPGSCNTIRGLVYLRLGTDSVLSSTAIPNNLERFRFLYDQPMGGWDEPVFPKLSLGNA